jgi:hypothetical protein
MRGMDIAIQDGLHAITKTEEEEEEQKKRNGNNKTAPLINVAAIVMCTGVHSSSSPSEQHMSWC